MTRLFESLFFRISFVFLLMLLVISAVYIYISVNTAEMYYQETRQKLDLNIASHISADNKCFIGDSVNRGVLKNVFHNVMVINPSIEVYLLDTNGTVLTYYAPNQLVKINNVPLAPVKEFISNEEKFVIGVDPKSPEKMKAFSAARVIEDRKFKGYIYVILGGQEYENASQLVFGSYILRLGLKAMMIALIAAAIIGFIAIAIIVRNLRKIVRVIHDFQKGNLKARIDIKGRGELKEFSDSFNDMADTIVNNIKEIRKMDELRRVLVANVSHDLRTPLSIIRGYAETIILKEQNLSPQERKDYLETILKSTDRLLKLVEELFELSKLETKETEPNKVNFSLSDLLQDIYQKNLIIAQKKEIKLTLDVAENLPFIMADIGMMEMAIQNLLDNAFKFTKPEGEVKIIFKRKYPHILLLTISDNGLGMKEEEIPYIFERYYQVKRVSYDKYIGSGLGLSIVKKILDLHIFEVNVKSEPSKGTSFLISIPVNSPTQHI
jgi:signal transduction histidine kinase